MLPLDLSSATKIKELKLLQAGSSVQWIVRTLQTVKSKSIQLISICLSTALPEMEYDHREWQDLDHLLIRFWTSHSIRPRVMYLARYGGKDLGDRFPSLLPELTRRGLVDIVKL